jgi:hypothetical protein
LTVVTATASHTANIALNTAIISEVVSITTRYTEPIRVDLKAALLN